MSRASREGRQSIGRGRQWRCPFAADQKERNPLPQSISGGLALDGNGEEHTAYALDGNIGSKASAASENERNDARYPTCLGATSGHHRVVTWPGAPLRQALSSSWSGKEGKQARERITKERRRQLSDRVVGRANQRSRRHGHAAHLVRSMAGLATGDGRERSGWWCALK